MTMEDSLCFNALRAFVSVIAAGKVAEGVTSNILLPKRQAILIVPAQKVKDYFEWRGSPAALTLVLFCGHSQYIRWGTYRRKSRPHATVIRLQRLLCLICHHPASAGLPAFLLGPVHYTTTTVAPYVDAIAAALEKLIVKRAQIRLTTPTDPTRVTASALTPHALCQSNSRQRDKSGYGVSHNKHKASR